MNIYLKILFALIAVNLLSAHAWSSGRDVSVSGYKKKQCEEAKYGKLKLDSTQNIIPLHNSYLFACAVSIIVPFPDEKPGSIKSRIEKKQKLADFLISRNIDVNFKDESGSTLLMSTVTSYLPNAWKIKIVKILISKKSDINAKNKYGKSAVDLAKFTKNSEITKILLMHAD